MDLQTDKKTRLFVEIAGWTYASSGVALALISFSSPALAALTALVVPEATTPDRALCVYAGVAGGLTVGLGASLIGVARASSLARAFRGLAVGLLSWFLVDTAASLAHGSWQNALGNLLFLPIGLLPLWRLGKATAPPSMKAEPSPA
jgi:hypothetical protein